MSELESLGLETPKLNELNDSYEVENLVDNLKQMLYQDYKSTHVFTDWQIIRRQAKESRVNRYRSTEMSEHVADILVRQSPPWDNKKRLVWKI